MRLTHSGRSTVLLAEPDRAVAERVMLAVRRACFDCDLVVVHDGMAVVEFVYAVEKLASRGLARTPDLLLLARNLPELDGLKVAKQLRWTHRDDLSLVPPIVVYSRCQNETESQIADAYRCGINSYLLLSEGDPRFGEEIQQAFIYWLYLNQAAKARRCMAKELPSKNSLTLATTRPNDVNAATELICCRKP